jgi:tetratricopeptide (TPR) repeat protein
MGGMPIRGEIVAYSYDSFRVRLADTGDIVTLGWSSLSNVERSRLQALVGYRAAETEQDVPAASGISLGQDQGPLLPAVRVVTKSGNVVEGRLVDERTTHEALYIKSARVAGVSVPKRVIRERQDIELPESRLYTRQERYERRLKQLVPQTAKDEYDMATYCAGIGHYEKARDHLERAIALDPRMEPLLADLRTRVEDALQGEMAERLYQQVMTAIQRRRYEEAVQLYDELRSGFPEHQGLSVLEERMTKVAELREANLRRQVINRCYYLYPMYCTRVVSERISEAQVPGWVITVRGGSKYIGVLETEDDSTVILKQWDFDKMAPGETTYQISKAQITNRVAKKLGGGAKRIRTYQECLDYCTDNEGGIGAEVREQVANELKTTVDEVKRIWDSRLNQVVTVDDQGRVQRNTRSYQISEASYGVGTWLREGGGSGGSRRSARNRRNRQIRRTSRNPYGRNRRQNRDVDPEEWWQRQSFDVRASIMKAFMAEAIMDVVRVQRYGIKDRKGEVIMDTNGNRIRMRDNPTDVGYKIKVLYR